MARLFSKRRFAIDSTRSMATALVLVAPIGASFAQTISHVTVGKSIEYVQTSATDVIPRTPAPGYGGAYGFGANVEGQNIGSITAPVIAGPIDVARLGSFFNNGRLLYNAQDAAWRLGSPNANDWGSPTRADLDSLFRSGTYTFTVQGASIPLQLTGDAYPVAPRLTLTGGNWSNGKYVIDPAQQLTMTTNAFTAYGSHANGVMGLEVDGFSQQIVQSHDQTPAPNFLTMTVPAGTFVTGREYSVFVTFQTVVDLRASAALPSTYISARYNTYSELTLKADASIPAPVFPMTVTANIGPTVSNATANIQYRPQDLGSVGSVYVFAVAPANIVNSVAAEPADPLRMKAKSDGKDAPVQCVLAQLSASGQLVGVSASSMQAYITGVLTAQTQAVTILNGVPTVSIGGAVFYVGYGPNAAAMLNGGINRRAVTVPGSLQCDPRPPQTGWWWNPLEDGRGYSIEVRGNNLFFASFLYDVSGRSNWYVATGATSLDGSLFNNELLGARSGQSLGGAYSGFPTLRNEGPITLAFNDAKTGTLVWPGGAVPIERFNIVSDGLNKPPSPDQPESGWWWNPNEAGRGFFLEWQGGILNIAGYMYDDAGNAVWYLTQNATPTTNAQSFSSTWWSFGNGMTLMGPWRPHSMVNNNVAPVTIQFQGSENAIMTLPNGRTTALTRHRF